MEYDLFVSTFAYDKILDLSATSVALCISAIDGLSNRSQWQRGYNQLTDTEWDYIDSIVGLALGELMSSLVGVIFPSVMATASAFKFLPCDGSIYNKSDYPLLYDAIDPVYIISGSQFATPDLTDRVPVGAGNQYAVNDSGGVDSVVLTVPELPSHNHVYDKPVSGLDIEGVGVPDPLAISNPMFPTQTTNTGSNQAHENRQPYIALPFIIVAG